ncbi:MAG: hypothetical protein AAGA03_13065 [Planctomycetota bacterium]
MPSDKKVDASAVNKARADHRGSKYAYVWLDTGKALPLSGDAW